MSESDEETPLITFTFQNVLNKNLARITDAFYYGTLNDCYKALAITMGLLKERHRNPLMQNELGHLDEELAQANRATGVDLYWTRDHRKNARLKVLRENLFDIYLKLMDLLHKHNYLEKTRHRAKKKDWEDQKGWLKDAEG